MVQLQRVRMAQLQRVRMAQLQRVRMAQIQRVRMPGHPVPHQLKLSPDKAQYGSSVQGNCTKAHIMLKCCTVVLILEVIPIFFLIFFKILVMLCRRRQFFYKIYEFLLRLDDIKPNIIWGGNRKQR